jgi:hypothetical protein
MQDSENGAAAANGLDSDAAGNPAGKPKDDRWTVRGVSKERIAMANAGAGDKPVGPWLEDAIFLKFQADRAQSKAPAVIPPEVTTLTPKAQPPDTLADNLAVLEAIRPFTDPAMNRDVRSAASKVAIGRLLALRVPGDPGQTRPTKGQKSLPKPGDSSDIGQSQTKRGDSSDSQTEIPKSSDNEQSQTKQADSADLSDAARAA